jgi:hypothetical protein
MRRVFVALVPLAIACVTLWTPGAVASTDVVTPSGQIMSSTDAATLNLPTADVPPPLVFDTYDLSDELVVPEADPLGPSGNNSTTFWGYEAAAGAAQLHAYKGYPNGPSAITATCVPTFADGTGLTANGRGVAFDPLTGDLWTSHVGPFPTFAGTGKIYLVVPPNVNPTCPEVKELVVHSKPGRPIQDDFGALDVDEATKHIWAAGYKPVVTAGLEKSYIYLINRNTGLVLQSCWIPFRGGGEGNDTLAVYRNPNLPGSSKYLLTDAGELTTAPDSYALIDQSDCHNGNQVTPILEFPKTTPGGVSGIDFEYGGLLNTNLSLFYNNHDAPFTTSTLLPPIGPQRTQAGVEDISVCGFRAKFGGDGNDFCPYP